MWLGSYLRTHGGLAGLAGALALLTIWALGGPQPTPPSRTSSATPRSAPTPGRAVLSAESVTELCRARGIPVSPPSSPRAEALQHPGFPTPRAAPKGLGSATRGVLGLRTRLTAMAQRQPGHAPLLHQAARGFAERFRFHAHLGQDAAKAEAYFRARARRRAEAGGARPTLPGTPDGGALPLTPADLATQALRDRRIALGYYQELAENLRLRPYSALPAALLEYAELLLSPAPASGGRKPRPGAGAAPTPAPRSLQLQLLAPYTQSRTERERALAALSQLVGDHPKAPEAVEAAAYLLTTFSGAERCRKLLSLLKALPPSSPPSEEGTLRDYLLRFTQFHAARCHLEEDRPDLAAGRLRTVLAPGAKPPAGLAPRFADLRREAALLLPSALSDDTSPEEARSRLAMAGAEHSPKALGLLAARWIGKGRLRAAATLCEPPSGAAPRSAPKRGTTP